MMLEYRNITKKFGNKEAVKELMLRDKKIENDNSIEWKE